MVLNIELEVTKFIHSYCTQMYERKLNSSQWISITINVGSSSARQHLHFRYLKMLFGATIKCK